MTEPSPHEQSTEPDRVAGIDYGHVRIGVALGDTLTKIATPWENYTRRSRELDGKWFCQLAREQGIDRFVVGLPVHGHGGESQKSQEARAFGAGLADITGVPVSYFDERYTSVEAEQILMAAELTKKRRKARLDMLAAQRILAAYLESSGRSEGIEDLDG